DLGDDQLNATKGQQDYGPFADKAKLNACLEANGISTKAQVLGAHPVTVDGVAGRRTVSRVPNNLNMYFRVDRRIAFDGKFAVSFEVTYYDTGTFGWTLQYDATEAPYKGAKTIVNQGTNTWKTVTITVDDARFAERENEQTDLRIASDQPVTLHSVRATVTGDGVLPMDLCP
ncbi:hypothetical protein ACFQ1S_29900, partial [Kibdelosporangium lantanae]